jgi:hypothetical protein
MFQSLFHCLESISEREPLLENAKNFPGNNAEGVVSREIQILFCEKTAARSKRQGAGGEPQKLHFSNKRLDPFTIQLPKTYTTYFHPLFSHSRCLSL